MLELDVRLSAEDVLAECRRRGLVIRNERRLAGSPGGRHWHLAFPNRAGTLELSESRDRVWLKVHPLRDGGWASALAKTMAAAAGARGL